MRMLINGVEGGQLAVPKGADKTFNCMLLADDGSLIPQTGETWTFEMYDRADRKNAAIFSVAAVVVTAAAGLVTFSPTNVNTGLFTAGMTAYGYAKRVDAGSKVFYPDKCVTVVVE